MNSSRATNASVIMPRLDTRGVESDALPPLRVAGVYADLPDRILAMRVFGNVTRKCSRECEINGMWWSFDMLSKPSFQQTAAQMARQADMIWCSTHACEPLPHIVRTWVDAWSKSKRESDAALVALLRCPPNYKIEHSPALACLAQAAHTTGMELFVQKFDCDCDASLDFAGSALRQQSGTASIEDHPNWQQFRHWGINE